MGIFSEVGKIITEEAKSDNTTKPKQDYTYSQIEDITPPPFEGEVILDGEDILPVVVINRVVSQKGVSTEIKSTEILSSAKPEPDFEEEKESLEKTEEIDDTNLSFWEDSSEKNTETSEDEETELEVQPRTIGSTQTLPTPATICGNVSFPNGANVVANIEGNVTAKKNLVFQGTITGNVEAENLTLCGTIQGSLICKKLTLLPINGSEMSCIKGSVHTEALYMDTQTNR